jgi:orotidine-5'-phosphate decarboxylase
MWMADPHVISALRSKRAELSGELIAAEKRILQLRTDIDNLDGAIRVFDPTAEPHNIRPILRRKKPTLIPRGQCSRAVLDMLRHADIPMTAREIAAQLAARYQMDASNVDAMKALVAKVRNTLARQKGLASGMRGDAKAWMVANGA